MYMMEASVVLSPGRYLTDEEITDLIEAAIDDLDTTTVGLCRYRPRRR
jgi:hypothetical protein